jgi:hypothetical protein
MMDSEWKSSVKWIIGIVAMGFVTWMALHFVGVIGTAATAPGRVINKTLETGNIIASYEWFHDTEAQYTTRRLQIVTHKKLIADEANPSEKSRLNIELAAMQQSCRELATKYNANSVKVNKSVFKGTSLPETLSVEAC